MAKVRPSPGAGNVPITLDGEDRELVPSLGACTFLSRQGGGLMGLVQRCGALDMDAIVMVIAQGLGLMGQGSKDLPNLVYRTGVSDLAGPCIRFINILANGGKPPSEEDAADADGDPRPAG